MAIFKFLKYFFLFILIGIIFLMGGFFIPRKWSQEKSCIDTVSIVISSNGFHTSFIVPVSNDAYDWTKDFPQAENYQYIEFGWGNKQFYMARDFSIMNVLRALFPSETVMHVVFLDRPPEKWFSNSESKRISICRQDYITLLAYIKQSFKSDKEGKLIYLDEGLYGPSAFYEGNGSYHGFETCNVWVAKGLREADVNTPLWAGTARSIMWHIRNYE
ncbi:MAG: TIGR02117 family protein [Cytophagaceae bacterium]|nr:TIGR02117 family protein [Cytophagaceae bacterium]